MKISKPVCLFYIFFLLLGSMNVIYAADNKPVKRSFSLVIREGFGSLGIGDLNTTLSSIDKSFDASRGAFSEYFSGEFPGVSGRFKNWEVEVRWAAWKGLSLGVALSGPVHLNGAGSISYLYSWTEAYSIASAVRLTGPIRFNVYYSLPIFTNMDLVLNGGVGIYRARMDQTYNWQRRYFSATQLDDNVEQIQYYHYDVSGRSAGLQFGAALEYRLNDRLSMLAEGQWCLAKIRSMNGGSEFFYETSYVYGGEIISSESYSEDGYLYRYIENAFKRELLAVYSDPDSVTGISDVRKATLDLDGFTFKIGLKIGLF